MNERKNRSLAYMKLHMDCVCRRFEPCSLDYGKERQTVSAYSGR